MRSFSPHVRFVRDEDGLVSGPVWSAEGSVLEPMHDDEAVLRWVEASIIGEAVVH